MILARLQYSLGCYSRWKSKMMQEIKYQFGFKKGKSTTDVLGDDEGD